MQLQDLDKKVKVAVAHVAPIMLDKRRTLSKISEYVSNAARAGAQLVVFGEGFVPGFPVWNMLYAPVDQHGFYQSLFENAVEIPSSDTDLLCDAARDNHIIVSIGVTERSSRSLGTMWNTNIIIDEKGQIVSQHRKIMATWAEKLSWANGDGSGLRVCSTAVGPVGMLICGENFNTLARFSLLAQGELLHISTYPPVWPTDRRQRGANDGYDLSEAIRIRAAAHSIEGKVFNVVAGYYLDEAGVDAIARGDEQIAEIIRTTPPGVSMVVGPDGRCIGDVVSGREELLFAELDFSEIIKYREFHDITGHYNRFDIFSLRVNVAKNLPLQLMVSGSEEGEQLGEPVDGGAPAGHNWLGED